MGILLLMVVPVDDDPYKRFEKEVDEEEVPL